MRHFKTTLLLVLAFAMSLVAACGKPADDAAAPAEETAASAEPAMETTDDVVEAAVEEEAPVPTRVDEMEAALSATVVAIDYEMRDIVLRGEEGNTFAFHVSEDVQRFEEISVGDQVNMEYIVTTAMELRAPTEEELAEPLVYLDEQLRATTTQPAGVEVQTIRAVTEIVGIDLPSETATLMGPLGNMIVVRAEDPANLASLSIGDTVIVTHREAMAIAIEKAMVEE